MTAANPPINSPVEPRVVVIPASTRSGSVNKALAEMIATEFHRQGEPTRVIDLAEYPMPLYDGDLEARDGVPATAVELARRLTRAEVLVVVSPEYNGTFTPLLKNTVDWLTRVDVSVLAHLFVLVASASPGRGGGANGTAMVRQWMANMGLSVAPGILAVAEATLDDHAQLRGLDRSELAEFVSQAAPLRRAA
ncbi:MAG: NAD(P)H-dependent oxidoreductase [Microthrixaceae bacterium]|nr:NAD(P)H-dependent oxidoreductase [Microthrixaceae bacterium]